MKKFACLLLILCLSIPLAACSEEAVPHRQPGESRPEIPTSSQAAEISSSQDQVYIESQKTLDAFFAAFNEKMGTDFPKDKDITEYELTKRKVLSHEITCEPDTGIYLFLKPDNAKKWEVNYYKRSRTGKVSIEVNEEWIYDPDIKQAKELYVYRSDAMAVVLIKKNEKVQAALQDIFGEKMAAVENPYSDDWD